MKYQIENRAGVLILSMKGRLLGEHQTMDLTEEIDEYIEQGLANFVVELSELEFINSTGLNFLLTLLTKGRKENGEVVLCNLNALLSNLLITTKLTSFFLIEKDVEAAMSHFGHLEKESTSS